MKRVEEDSEWTLMCPNECPGLHENWGEKFEELYLMYEREGRGRKKVKAQELWSAIIDSQIETGVPYMLYKDHANGKSTSRTWELLRAAICALRSSSTLLKMRWPYATLPQSPFLDLCKMVCSTTTSSTRSLRPLHAT